MGRSERERTSAAMAPVVLRTDVHCFGCAKKIRRSVRDLLGVEKVWASPDTGLVHVAGTADAAVLRRRIQDKMRRPVSIVSDGTGDQLGHRYGMMHPAPPHYAPTPAGLHQPLYYSWASTSSHPHHHYAPPQPAGHTYGGNHYWAPQPRRYVSNGTPTRFDDEIPDQYCCSIQ